MRKVPKFEKWNASGAAWEINYPDCWPDPRENIPFLKILSSNRMIRVPWKVSARGWNIARKFVRFSRGVRCKKTDKETYCRLNAARTHLAWMDLRRDTKTVRIFVAIVAAWFCIVRKKNSGWQEYPPEGGEKRSRNGGGETEWRGWKDDKRLSRKVSKNSGKGGSFPPSKTFEGFPQGHCTDCAFLSPSLSNINLNAIISLSYIFCVLEFFIKSIKNWILHWKNQKKI